jgi:acyl-CoA thioesterase
VSAAGSAGDDELSPFDESLLLDATAPGTYERVIDTTWWGWNGQFGGYVLALALEAARRHNPDPALSERSLTLHFLRRLPEGACRVEVVTERQGRTAATFSIRMFVEDRLCVAGLALFGSDRRNEEFQHAPVPPLDPPVGEPSPVPLPGQALDQLDVWPGEAMRFPMADPPEAVGGWMRLRNGGRADERFLVLAGDAYPPAFLFHHSRPAIGGTLEFTAHFRTPPPDSVVSGAEPVRLVLRVAASQAGYIDEDCEIWSADGRLLMQSRQLRYNELSDDAPVKPSTAAEVYP